MTLRLLCARSLFINRSPGRLYVSNSATRNASCNCKHGNQLHREGFDGLFLPISFQSYPPWYQSEYLQSGPRLAQYPPGLKRVSRESASRNGLGAMWAMARAFGQNVGQRGDGNILIVFYFLPLERKLL